MTCWATLSPASTTPAPTSAPSWPRTGPRVWSMTRTRLTFQRPRPRCDPGIKIGIRDIIMREDYSHLQKRIWSRKDQLFVCLTILHDEISYIWECFASLLVRPELRITAWCLINICPPHDSQDSQLRTRAQERSPSGRRSTVTAGSPPPGWSHTRCWLLTNVFVIEVVLTKLTRG